MGLNLRKLGSRIFDQVNVFDNNRTFKQRTPTQSKSTFQQGGQFVSQVGRGTVPALARMYNTAEGQANQLNATKDMYAAQALGRLPYISKMASIQDKSRRDWSNANQRALAADEMFKQGKGGFLDKGTWYSKEDAKRGDLKTGVKKIGAGTLDAQLEAASLMYGSEAGSSIGKYGIKGGLQAAAPAIAKNAALNAVQGAYSTKLQGGSNKDALKAAALGATLGTATDVGLGIGTNLLGKGLKTAGKIEAAPKPSVSLKKQFVINEGVPTAIPPKPLDIKAGVPLANNPRVPQKGLSIVDNNPTGFKITDNSAPRPVVGVARQAQEAKLNAADRRIVQDYFESKPAVKGSALSGKGAQLPGAGLTAEAKKSLIDRARAKIKPLDDQSGFINGPQDSPIINGIRKALGKEDLRKPKVALKNDSLSSDAYAETFGISKQQAVKELSASPTKAPTSASKIGPIDEPRNLIPPSEVKAKSFKEAKPQFNETTNKWLGKKQATQTQNIATVSNLPKLDSQNSLGLMDNLEKGIQDGDFSNAPVQVRGLLDAKHAELKANGIDIGYLQDYFPHKWQNATAAEVNQAYQTLNMRAGIMNERTIPTVSEGMKLGFKPVTTDYRVAVKNYLDTADKLMANREYFNGLKQKGLIAESGSRPNGMQVVDAPGIPQPRPFTDPATGNSVQGNYYAKPDVANKLNRLFGEQEANKALAATAKASKGIQTVTLAGGLPGTPLNAFGTANWLKQSLEGHPVTATKSFFRSFSEKASLAHEQANLPYITKMQEAGVPYRGGLDTRSLQSFGDVIAEKHGLGKGKTAIMEGWNKAVEDPTFKRFLPALQLDTFKGVYEKAIKKGMAEADATKLAADTTRHAFGLNELTKDALKSKNMSNAISTGFFAPRFREGMVNFWLDNAKSLGKVTDPAYRENVKFMANATLLFGFMQAANYALNGHSTFQNENPNDRLNLSIPKGDGSSVSVPFLSSIATVPRMAVNTIVDLAQNQKYNGRPVYNEKDPAGKRMTDQASYFVSQYNHPYIQAGTAVATGKSSGPLETIATALEAPLRFRDAPSPEQLKAKAKGMVSDLNNGKKFKGGQGPSEESKGLYKLPDGKYTTLVDDQYHSFKTREEATKAQDKNMFKYSNDRKKVVGDTVYFKNKDDKVTTKPKVLYDWEQTDAKLNLEMDRAYGAKDTQKWTALAQQKWDGLEKKKSLYDPSTEQDEIDKITLAQENLQDKASKYLAQGGFTKGKSGGSGGGGGAIGYYGKSKVSTKGTVAKSKVTTKDPGKLKGSVKYATSSKPKVSIKKSLV